MKIGFCVNVLRNDELVPAMYRLAELGYHGVEVWQRQVEQNRWPVLRAAIADAGLAVAQLCPYFDLVNGPANIEASVKLAEEYIRLAADCPGEPALVRVFTGPLTGPGSLTSANCSQEIWAQAVKALRRICQLGAAAGVRLAVETHPGTLADTIDSILALLRDVAADNLALNLQVPLEDEADPLAAAAKLAPHVVHLHANNYAGDKQTFLADGDYDFAAFLRAVRAGGRFDGYISIEHGQHHPVWQTAVVEAEYLKKLLAQPA